jgi:hypothetical protein
LLTRRVTINASGYDKNHFQVVALAASAAFCFLAEIGCLVSVEWALLPVELLKSDMSVQST